MITIFRDIHIAGYFMTIKTYHEENSMEDWFNLDAFRHRKGTKEPIFFVDDSRCRNRGGSNEPNSIQDKSHTAEKSHYQIHTFMLSTQQRTESLKKHNFFTPLAKLKINILPLFLFKCSICFWVTINQSLLICILFIIHALKHSQIITHLTDENKSN